MPKSWVKPGPPMFKMFIALVVLFTACVSLFSHATEYPKMSSKQNKQPKFALPVPYDQHKNTTPASNPNEQPKVALPVPHDQQTTTTRATNKSNLTPLNTTSSNGVHQGVNKVKQLNLSYYERLSKPWKGNHTALQKLREKLIADRTRRPDMLIATQANTAVGQNVRFYITSDCPKGRNKHTYRMEKSIHTLLPKESPFGKKRFKKCSLVGNGGILLHSGCGSEIDSADFAFRFNAPSIHKYEHDVGTKSNLTTFNPSIFFIRFGGLVNDSAIESFQSAMKEYSGLLCFSCLASCKYLNSCLDMIRRYNVTENQFVNGYPDSYVAFRKYWKLKKLPTTGFYFVSAAMTLCDEVHLYGFWPFAEVPRGNHTQGVPYHYFDSMTSAPWHDTDWEFDKLVELHELGIIRLHVEPCPQT